MGVGEAFTHEYCLPGIGSQVSDGVGVGEIVGTHPNGFDAHGRLSIVALTISSTIGTHSPTSCVPKSESLQTLSIRLIYEFLGVVHFAARAVSGGLVLTGDSQDLAVDVVNHVFHRCKALE